MTDLRAAILGLDDLPRRKVEVPEWKDALDAVEVETVSVRALTAGEVEEFGEAVSKGNFLNVMARLVVRVLVDEVGSRIFGDDDVAALSGKNAAVVKRLFDEAQRASGLLPEEGEEAEPSGNE